MVILLALALVLVAATAAIPQRAIHWKAQGVTPVQDYPHQSLVALGRSIEQMSGGRLILDVLPANSIVPTTGVLDAIHAGKLDASLSWPGFWVSKNAAAGLFAAPLGGPFGLGSHEFTAWLIMGGGQELYNELLQRELRLDVVAFFTTHQPLWEAFGWSTVPITNLKDLRALKFRSSGSGVNMFRSMGVQSTFIPGPELLLALQQGTIDGLEWAIPGRDLGMGFHRFAKYYYAPSFRQPPTFHELLINQARWEQLPKDLQAIVRHAALAELVRFGAFVIHHDAPALQELVQTHGVKFSRTPDDILRAELEAIDKTLAQAATKQPFFARVMASQHAYARRTVVHGQRMLPPIETAIQRYWRQER